MYKKINKQCRRYVRFLLGSVLVLQACSGEEQPSFEKALAITGISATGPYLTQDHEGRPVICWTEQDQKDSLYRLKYAIYDQLADTIGPTVTVPGSVGCGASAESMGKVAFKADGTVMALFAKPFPKEKNPFAGAIYYSMSSDAGRNWSDPRFLHSDTSHAYGRNFFDIARLKDGELAAIWLDGRFARQIKGSSLFFSKTEKGTGFEKDVCLEKGTCECCRTNLLADEHGNIHIAYRGIQFPSALSGKQVRDMLYMRSTDQGNTFSAPRPISIDNWEIDGCPHSGPSMSFAANMLHVVWYTAGGKTGIYTTSSAPEVPFKKRQLVTTAGRHPQMVTLSDHKTVMICEENMETPEASSAHQSHKHHPGMSMQHTQAVSSKIVLRILNNGQVERTVQLTDGQYADHHPVLRLVDHGLLIAWVREEGSGSRIYLSNRHLSEQ